MEPVIHVENLRKVFQVPMPPPEGGRWSKVKHFLANPCQPKVAVEKLSFEVQQGEIIGFLGANGSGKSTTVKMLTGILSPTSGSARVLSFDPWRERAAYVRNIGLVMGQKSLLWWNIPVIESLRLYRDIYDLSEKAFQDRLAYLTEVLDLDEFLHVPVRKLSLGQRMRAEIVASLLHKPKVIFLDEPTIGLDVLGRQKLKQFLQLVNSVENITIVLTTHNMLDVEDLCRRCLIMDRGQLVYQGEISELKRFENTKVLELEIAEILDEEAFDRLLEEATVLSRQEMQFTLQVSDDISLAVIDKLFRYTRLANLNVIPPSLELIISKFLQHPQEVQLV